MQVVCVRWGNKYGQEYVDNLYRMVKKNLTVPFRFTCFTDKPGGGHYRTKKLFPGLWGWYNKIYLFSVDFKDTVLFLDLDTLITGNIDHLADYKGRFAILRDFYRPDGYGSGVMLWNGCFSNVFTDYIRAGAPELYHGDQEWMERMFPQADILQDIFPGNFVSFKEHCREGRPKDAKVVCFHGEPKPHNCGQKWVGECWRG